MLEKFLVSLETLHTEYFRNEMTAGFGNRIKKFDDPNLEKSADKHLSPDVPLTDQEFNLIMLFTEYMALFLYREIQTLIK